MHHAWRQIRYRPVEITSILRPDYYEFFPSFSDCELISRFSRMRSLEACAFMIPNIRRAIALRLTDAAAVLSSLEDTTLAATRFSKYLETVGFMSGVSDQFRKVDRRRFVPPAFHGYEWINESVPVSYNTWLSAPGIVAIMLEISLRTCPYAKRIVEVGSGTGFHLACVRQLFPNSVLIGYEAELQSINYANKLIDDDRISFVYASTVQPDEQADLVFCTFQVSAKMRKQLYKNFPNAVKIFPSTIDEKDFEDATVSGKPFLAFESYDDYLLKSASFQKIGAYNTEGECIEHIFDVRFIQEIDCPIESSGVPSQKSAIELFIADVRDNRDSITSNGATC